MRDIVLVTSGPPFVLWAPDVVSTWFINRELTYRELEIGTANNLARAYDKVYLLTHDDQGKSRNYVNQLAGNVQVLFKPRGIPNSVYRMLAPLIFRRYFKNVCICRTYQLRGCLTALVIKSLFGTKLVLRQGYQVSSLLKEVLRRGSPRPFRGRAFYVITVFLELIAYHAADVIMVSSHADKDYVLMKYRVDARRIFVVPNWVDVNLFKPLPGIHKERGRVVFVGKLDLPKNVFSLVDAVRGLSDVKLYLIGDGPLRESLEQKLRNQRIDNVVLLGMVPHRRLPFELNLSEVFVLPSFYEGNPKALLEAMACGLPVIGADVTGIRELTKDGVTGLLCNTNSQSIRAAIVQLLGDSELRNRLGINARTQVESHYGSENILEKEMAVHSTILRHSN